MKYENFDFSKRFENIFKSLAGLTEKEKEISIKVVGSQTIVEGKTSKEGVLYSASLIRVPCRRVSTTYSVYSKDKEYPAIEVVFRSSEEENDKDNVGAIFIQDFLKDFKDIIKKDKPPLSNFSKYYTNVKGEDTGARGFSGKKLINLNNDQGVLIIGCPKITFYYDYMRFSMPFDGSKSSYIYSSCEIKVDKEAEDSIELEKLLDPTIEGLENFLTSQIP